MAFKLLKKTLAGAAAQQLTATNTRCSQVLIQAARNNAALVTVGDSTVAAGGGIELVKPVANAQIDVITLKAAGVGNNIDLSHIYVIGTNADVVNVFYEEF